ncbi:flap endonuclease 1-A isoform X1 [Iris pallida]|uniref:Flap endonuclease 1-A isoform X1 n=1 Tax=Iris pallida TaxID=29817 RepID=A0AAX6EV51_IRIPA|nr:flap endonuclease 1-A isoform X1 [Iris pallida]
MGIKGLTKLLADNAPKSMKDQKFESYFGRKIAIDSSMSIYQIVVERIGAKTLTNEAGETTRFVFDGQPPDLKKPELAKRYSRKEDATMDLNAAIEAGDKEGIEKFSKRTVKGTYVEGIKEEVVLSAGHLYNAERIIPKGLQSYG